MAAKWAPGTAVEVWTGNGRWIPAVVLDEKLDGSVHIRYGPSPPDLDTERERWLGADEVPLGLRSVARAASPAAVLKPIASSGGRTLGLRPLGPLTSAGVNGKSAHTSDGTVKPAGTNGSSHSAAVVDSSSDAAESTLPVAQRRRQRCNTAGATESSCFAALRREFMKIDADGSGSISAGELALSWARSAEERAQRELTAAEREVIAGNVQRRAALLDVDRTGQITVDEWLHQALLERHPPGTAISDAIAARLRERGLQELSRLVRAWGQLDVDGDGSLSREELVAGGLCDSASSGEMFSRLDADGSGEISYAEYCAHELGLTFEPVVLYYYDIANGVAQHVTPMFVGRRNDGIWHTGVVVFGYEYFYGGGVFTEPPGETCFGEPTKKLKLGLTLRTEGELDRLVEETLEREFTEENYDVFDHNCNCFSDAVTMFLLGKHIPDEVRKQPLNFQKAAFVRLIRPLLNRWLGHIDGKHKDKHGRVVEAAGVSVESSSNSPSKRMTRLPTLAEIARKEASDIVIYRKAHVAERHKTWKVWTEEGRGNIFQYSFDDRQSATIYFQGLWCARILVNPYGEESLSNNGFTCNQLALASVRAAAKRAYENASDDATYPVVAQVKRRRRIHETDMLDLCWFDRDGQRHTAEGVPQIDVEPYVRTSDGEDGSQAVYFAALLALDKPEAADDCAGSARVLRLTLGNRLQIGPTAKTDRAGVAARGRELFSVALEK
eukprot:TRINITY_DN8384_c1_g1_i1.p1 TRINITY_DN8384_c1_g1~~TRINITY_DN8384_c1_g1_i1.p1  ORF type:complete len:725 (-),score=133.95 TRINITY_DN8384_c1_g1_i1:178-2352(-)